MQPTSANRWRTVALKEQTGNLVYALYGNNSGQRASANLFLGGSEAEARSASQLPCKRLDTSRCHLRRRDHPPVRERNALRLDDRDRLDARLHRPLPDRRQRHLGRVLLRPARRSSPLQPRPLGDRGPGRHGNPGRAAAADRYAGAKRSGRARRDRRPELGGTQLDRLDRQRRRRPLQRPPQHDLRLHAECCQPDRPACGRRLQRPWPRARHLLLPRHRRGRRRQRERGLEPGDRSRDG